MENKFNLEIQLPPGFRFHPSDEELIVHYLRNKATASSLPASIIAEVDLYKCNPWELPSKALFGEEEWYFFTPRDRKYPNGARPNRMAASGYWKATGTDKPVLSSHGRKILGVKKALVFYKGHPPTGVKTNWIMHQYRLPEATMATARQKGCMRLDDRVLCRVRQKINMSGNSSVKDGCGSNNEPLGCSQKREKTSSTTPDKAEMVKDFLYRDCLVLPLIFAAEDLPFLDTVSSKSFEASRPSTNSVSEDHSDTSHSRHSDSLIDGKKRKPHEGNQSSIQSKEKLTDKHHRLSDDNTELNFCSTDQSEGDNFNPHSMEFSDPISRFNHLAFPEDD